MLSLRWFRTLPLSLCVALAACGGSIRPPAGGPGGASPRDVLQRFLQLADAQRYLDMAWLYGTARGPFARDVEPAHAERRMFLLACLLRGHQREVVRESPIPGSVGGAVEAVVRLRNGAEQADVPFRMVLGAENRWYVEELQLEPITRSRLPMSPECRAPSRAPAAR